MNRDVAFPDLASCTTPQIRTEYLGGIQWFCDGLHLHSIQMRLAIEQAKALFWGRLIWSRLQPLKRWPVALPLTVF